jgi:hypothetical protein
MHATRIEAAFDVAPILTERSDQGAAVPTDDMRIVLPPFRQSDGGTIAARTSKAIHLHLGPLFDLAGNSLSL